MEGSGPSTNLDSLIRNFSDDELGVLKISDEATQRSVPVDDDPDSDSSYEKMAKANADLIYQKIHDVQKDLEMKAARIKAAKLSRQKEIEESQDKNKGYKSSCNSFKSNSGNSKNDKSKSKGPSNAKSYSSINEHFKDTSRPIDSFQSKNPSKSKSIGPSNSKNHSFKENFKESSQPIDGSSQYKNPSKLNDRPLKNNTQHLDKKFKKNISNKSKVDEAQKTDVEKTNDISSKMKNVTIQCFDIDSSPSSCSDDEMDLEQFNRVLDGYQKSFTVRSLNRKEEVISISDEDQEENPEESAMLLPRFQSAEKSAASQRRKRSNYLKKRHSNFKKIAEDKDNDPTDPKPSVNTQDCHKTEVKRPESSNKKFNDNHLDDSNRRKQPNNLKKRSNFKKNTGDKDSDQSYPKTPVNTQNSYKTPVNKAESSDRKLDKITDKTHDYHSDDSIKVEKVIIVKQSKSINPDKTTGKTPLRKLDDKKNENFNDTPAQKEKNIDKDYTKNKDVKNPKVKRDKSRKDVKFSKNTIELICKSDKSKVINDKNSNKFNDPGTTDKMKPKNPYSRFNINSVGECSSSTDNNDGNDLSKEPEDDEVPRILLKLDLSQPSMNNDIDWEATNAIYAAKFSKADFAFESDEEINFTSLVRNVSELKKSAPTCNNNLIVEQDGSSSDLEAEFDATLVGFVRNK